MNIGLDIDGVFYKFTKAYHLWLNEDKGMSLDPEVEAESWDWFLDWETAEEFGQNLHDSVDAGHMYWVGELYEPTMSQNLKDLKAAGHSIHFVTARTFGKKLCPEAATRHWLNNNDLVFDTLTISKDKTILRTDVFLEDNLKNYDLLDAAGIHSYLVNRPYNLQEDNRRRVNTVDEFTKLILEDKCYSSASSAAY